MWKKQDKGMEFPNLQKICSSLEYTEKVAVAIKQGNKIKYLIAEKKKKKE